MAPEQVAEVESDGDTAVMASVEEGSTDTFIIADVSCDDAYLTVPLDQAAALPAWR